MNTKIDHAALYCLDLEAMRDFFVKYFNCTANSLYHNPRTGLRTYILSFPGGDARLEIMSRPEVTELIESMMHSGFIHLSISVGSKEAVDCKSMELDAAGYACIDGPRTTGDGYYEAQICGPEGIALEITI